MSLVTRNHPRTGARPRQTAELPLRSKLLYSSSSLGSEALVQSRGLWLLYYYSPPADADLPELLPLGVAGALVFSVRLLCALDDVLIGYWSDRTRSSIGRRLPFVLAATPLWALFAFLLFTPPTHSGTTLTALYLFMVLELYSIFSTLSGGPYESLFPEIARSTADRISVVGLKVYFGAAGAAAGLVVSGLLVDRFGFKVMALVLAGLALVCRYVGMVGIWHRASRETPPALIPLRQALRSTFSNRYFILFLPSFVLFQIGLQMLLGLLPYWVSEVLRVEEEGTWVAVLTAATIGTMVVSIPVFVHAARRRAKRVLFRWAMLGAALVFPLLFFAGFVPGAPKEVQIVVLMAAAGVPAAGVFLFPAALTADIIDYDSLQSGMRREAVYFGAQNLVEKTATASAPLLLVGLLMLGNSTANPLGIRLVGPVAGLIVFVGYLVFRSLVRPGR
jgi:GPH family glycoside/pentoside/hexuronide:cation symporter